MTPLRAMRGVATASNPAPCDYYSLTSPLNQNERRKKRRNPPEAPAMIVDFQHHFTPRELIKEDPGDRLVLNYDALGAPSYTVHSLLYDLDEHVAMMDLAGIDAAWLTSAAGMCA